MGVLVTVRRFRVSHFLIMRFLVLERESDGGFEPVGCFADVLGVDAGLDVHGVEQAEEVFGAEVSGSAGCVGAPAEATDGAVEVADAFDEAGEGVGLTEPAGVVEVESDVFGAPLGDGSS